jgi:hypothetical protein
MTHERLHSGGQHIRDYVRRHFASALLRRTLPKHHLNEHARTWCGWVGLIAAIAALVLGLLINA